MAHSVYSTRSLEDSLHPCIMTIDLPICKMVVTASAQPEATASQLLEQLKYRQLPGSRITGNVAHSTHLEIQEV
jgi:hypothetical protein